MKPYANKSKCSDIKSYYYSRTFIVIQLSTGLPYKYTYDTAGQRHVDNMKKLADEGDGLFAYIRENCMFMYEL